MPDGTPVPIHASLVPFMAAESVAAARAAIEVPQAIAAAIAALDTSIAAALALKANLTGATLTSPTINGGIQTGGTFSGGTFSSPKINGALRTPTGNAKIIELLEGPGTLANYFVMRNCQASEWPQIYPEGPGANIDIQISGKGTGVLRVATATAGTNTEQAASTAFVAAGLATKATADIISAGSLAPIAFTTGTMPAPVARGLIYVADVPTLAWSDGTNWMQVSDNSVL